MSWCVVLGIGMHAQSSKLFCAALSQQIGFPIRLENSHVIAPSQVSDEIQSSSTGSPLTRAASDLGRRHASGPFRLLAKLVISLERHARIQTRTWHCD